MRAGSSLATIAARSLDAARNGASTLVSNASLRVFRALFGLLMLGALLRSWQKGVIEQAFLAPTYHFPYYGLGFVHSPRAYTFALYIVLGALALGIALGSATRLCSALFCLLFSYLHFVDETYYLNHYYLVSLLSGLLAVVPLRASLAGDRTARDLVPCWVLWLFRFQFGVVYFFGGVAKLKADWLFSAEPLRTWLAASTELPLLGKLFTTTWGPFALSWLGALYDLSIPFALLSRRTRGFAYLAVLAFHTLTARLFNIGLFPYLMMVGSLLFLAPAWPRRVAPWLFHASTEQAERTTRTTHAWRPRVYVPLVLFVSLQLLLPLRRFAYPGNVLWSEQGYRFAWNVMLMEKSGAAEFRVEDRATKRQRLVDPRSILTRSQTKAMATQPDMILSFAHELCARERALGRDVAVYADVFVALNGRAPARLVDPRVDLAREQESFANKRWILPAPK